LSPAPVLAYHTATAKPAGLQVEQRAGGCLIDLSPPPFRTKVRDGALFSVVFVLGIAAVILVLARASRGVDPRLLLALALVHCVLGPPAMFASLLVASFLLRTKVRIEVSPAIVRLSVSGFRLAYETVWNRDDIVAVEARWMGILVKRRDRRRGDWITFGTRAEQRRICLLLGEALGVPVTGATKPGPALSSRRALPVGPSSAPETPVAIEV
jgi:hypothetical protein